MVYKSCYSDTYYTTTADTFSYRIELDGAVIYSGKAVKMPNADVIRINVNKICQNYLSNNLESMINPVLTGGSPLPFIENAYALRVFDLIDNRTNQTVESYMFLYDYNYVELWSGQLQNRWYESGETEEQVIIITPTSSNVGYEGGNVTITVQYLNGDTNDVDIYATNGASVEDVIWNGDMGTVVVNVPANTGTTDKDYTVVISGSTATGATTINQTSAAGSISVNVNELDYAVNGGVQYVDMDSNGNWTLTYPNWLTVTAVERNSGVAVNPSAGSSGSYRFTVVANANSGSTLEGNMVFTTGNVSKTVAVSQASNISTVSVSPTAMTVANSGTTQVITITSNGNWSITKPDWVVLSVSSGSGNGTVTVTVPSNSGTSRSGNIVFTAGQSTATVSVSQAAAPDYITLSPNSMSFVYSGETKSLSISSNVSWVITAPAWITASSTAGTGNATITLTASNNTGSSRSGNVIVSGGSASTSVSVSQSDDNTAALSEYLTFEILSAGTITWQISGVTGETVKGYFRSNGGSWVGSTTTGGVTLGQSVSQGDIVEFKSEGGRSFRFSASTATFNVRGNIMSLIGFDDFSGMTTLETESIFLNLFRNSKVVDASKLLLPATTLSSKCYYGMFSVCHYLVTPPSTLPATILANNCYENMFSSCELLTSAPTISAISLANTCCARMFVGCTSLTTAPSLPATTLAQGCYNQMFERCTSLTTAPELPATTLERNCYLHMFNGCSNLNYVKCLATNLGDASNTTDWLSGVSASGTFVKNSLMSGWSSGVSGIPTGWTVQNA